MRGTLTPVIPPAISPTLEDVQQQFETWRKRRRCRSKISEVLWQRAVELCRVWATPETDAKPTRLYPLKYVFRCTSTFGGMTVKTEPS